MTNNKIETLLDSENLTFENWIILEGLVISPPIKMNGEQEKEIFYNFKIDNGKFKMNCTIITFEEDKDDEIFSSIINNQMIKVCGNLHLKKKKDKLWVQINVRNWVEYKDENKRISHKVN